MLPLRLAASTAGFADRPGDDLVTDLRSPVAARPAFRELVRTT